MSREALVVGISSYQKKSKFSSSAIPSNDANAIASLLARHGEFNVRQLPETIADGKIKTGRAFVTKATLEKELKRLFPEGDQAPDTALFYFAGHGISVSDGLIPKNYLVTSDADPKSDNWGISLQEFCKLLKKSGVRQQIVWLDCCNSGKIIQLSQADPRTGGQARDLCFIAASRSFDEAYESLEGNHGVLTNALLKGLTPERRQAEEWINNLSVSASVSEYVDLVVRQQKQIPQVPVFSNYGEPIKLVRVSAEFVVHRSTKSVVSDNCPYVGLTAFDTKDAEYFYGREALIDQLLEKIHLSEETSCENNFLAVLGPSGSGKSSAVKAGLLHQLSLGLKISGSDQWKILNITRPGENPLKDLSMAFIDQSKGKESQKEEKEKIYERLKEESGLIYLVEQYKNPRVVLVVDQLEEVFTQCKRESDREAYLDCLLTAVSQCQKLCLVITMRADFFGEATQYCDGRLAEAIQSHLVTVTPMHNRELRDAIIEPAWKVGLDLEPTLVSQLLIDTHQSSEKLPQLQFVLRELWLAWHKEYLLEKEKGRSSYNSTLTLSAYDELGGIEGTVEKRAEEKQKSFSETQRKISKAIFLELTQLSDGNKENTCRQVKKQSLLKKLSAPETFGFCVTEIEFVLNSMTDAQLIVTSDNDGIPVVDIAHESLIRVWPRLRQWIDENREDIDKRREVERDAKDWIKSGKSATYLMTGERLLEAEEQLSFLNEETQSFIQASREFSRRKIKRSSVLLAGAATTLLVVCTRLVGLLQPFEFAMYDHLLRQKPNEPVDDRFLIVEVDNGSSLYIQEQLEQDASMRRIGSIPDDLLEKALTVIESYRPALIGLDIYRDYSAINEDLASRLRESEHLIGICKAGERNTENKENATDITDEPQEPTTENGVKETYEIPPAQHSDRIGFVDVDQDNDTVVRRHYLVKQADPNFCNVQESFSLLLALRYISHIQGNEKFIKEDVYTSPVYLDDGVEKVNSEMRLGDVIVPRLFGRQGPYHNWTFGYQTLVNFRTVDDKIESFAPSISFERILNGDVDAELIKDKIVLIGIADLADRNADSWKTPFGYTSGVVLHAQMASQLISNADLYENRPLLWCLSTRYELLVILGCAILGGIAVRSIYRPYLIVVAVFGGTFLIYLVGRVMLISMFGVLPVIPAITSFLATGCIVVLLTQRARRPR